MRSCCVALALLTGVYASTARAEPAQKRVIRLEVMKVEGRIRKPQAFYVLQRSNLNFEALRREQSFLPKIVASVDAAPF